MRSSNVAMESFCRRKKEKGSSWRGSVCFVCGGDWVVALPCREFIPICCQGSRVCASILKHSFLKDGQKESSSKGPGKQLNDLSNFFDRV